MSVRNWYATRALRFVILYVVALCAIRSFAVLASLAQTPTIFDEPIRIAVLAALGIGWPTFVPSHFDWLRTLLSERRALGSVRAAAVIWSPFILVGAVTAALGNESALANDVATTWAIAGMLALTDREYPEDRRRLKRDADEALRRLVASYEAVYGPAVVPVPIAS